MNRQMSEEAKYIIPKSFSFKDFRNEMGHGFNAWLFMSYFVI